MKRMFKYEIPVDDEKHAFNLPWGARIRHVDHQGRIDSVCMWAEVDDLVDEKLQRWFKVYGTGHEVPAGSPYIGTVVVTPNLVWHVFEII